MRGVEVNPVIRKEETMNGTPTTKKIKIVCTRPKKETDVTIDPTDSAADVLSKAGFGANEFYMLKPGDGGDYAPTDPVFNDVPDGGKFHVMPQSSVAHVN